MTNESRGYRDVLGSDVPNDGMYIELHNASDEVVACVFRSDANGDFQIHHGPASVPSDELAAFTERAKARLIDLPGG